MRGKQLQFLAGIVTGAVLFGGGTAAAAGVLANPSWQPIYVDGEQVQMEAYNINGSNYVKLRDIGKEVGFNVFWQDGVQVDSSAPYTGEAPAKEAITVQVIPPQTENVETLRREIVDLTNGLRRQQGLSTLDTNAMLTKAAQTRAEEMAATGTYSHTRPDGSDNDTLTDCRYISENIHRIADWTLELREQSLADAAVEDWYESAGHRDIMLKSGVDNIGVGLARGTNHDGMPCWYCVQLFQYGDYPITWIDAPILKK